MAIRNMLHKNQLEPFKAFLESRGYMILPTVGKWEVLRAKCGKGSPVIVYERKDAKEHLSIMDKDYHLVREFLEGAGR